MRDILFAQLLTSIYDIKKVLSLSIPIILRYVCEMMPESLRLIPQRNSIFTLESSVEGEFKHKSKFRQLGGEKGRETYRLNAFCKFKNSTRGTRCPGGKLDAERKRTKKVYWRKIFVTKYY